MAAKKIAAKPAPKPATKVAAKPAPQPAAKPTSPLPRPFHAVVENVQPLYDHGRGMIKAIPGESVTLTADIFRDGHEKCEASILFRRRGEKTWLRAPMAFVDNDLWQGSFSAGNIGTYEYTVEARTLGHGENAKHPYRDEPYVYEPFGTLRVDAEVSQYSAWYEMWAKSQGTDPNRSATFEDMKQRLPEIKDMGFDVLYLPPIHPIGITKRKGRNNSVTAQPGEPGCPYAIGNHLGGHKAVDPELGTLKECEAFLKHARSMGFTLALDFALNCSPDHPYVKAHPDWFYREKDGTIKCAENPPKRYEDVYPLNFHCADREALWLELKSVIEFWVAKGFTIFRVDNPHTKPFEFWRWLIDGIKSKHPEVVFLSEAFTRPKVMHHLAKLGFDMSYTYFTWRTHAKELREYGTELTQGPAKDYMKGIFFPTTPDILPWHLQNAPREMFQIRFALAATLSSTYGIYNSYELCEGRPYPGKEEFVDSEKYQYKVWDWNRPGHIKDFIKRINQMRQAHPCLQLYKNLRFHDCDNDQILVYSKALEDDIIVFAVNLDPHHTQGGFVQLDLKALGLENEHIFGVHDLMTGENYVWTGPRNFVELTPQRSVLHALKVERF
jgi:starch synthase (maltosyl-transferring)